MPRERTPCVIVCFHIPRKFQTPLQIKGDVGMGETRDWISAMQGYVPLSILIHKMEGE